MKLTAGEWDELRSKRADINDLVIARIVGDHVEPRAPLQEGMEKIEDIRLSPRDEAVAFRRRAPQMTIKTAVCLSAGSTMPVPRR